MRTTIPLQIKLTSQRLMVSTQNTSRSNTNPPMMQNQPGDVDSRPPGGELETVQIGQQGRGELEQLTNKYDALRRHDKPEKTKTLLPEKRNTSTLVEKRIEKEKLATPGSMILTNPPERIATRSGHGSKGSRTSIKKSAT